MTQEAMTTDSGSQAAGDRSTTFQAVQGEPEHYSGEMLLVTAYAIIWVILLLWLALVWRKQSSLDARLGDLEGEIGKAASPNDGKRRP